MLIVFYRIIPVLARDNFGVFGHTIPERGGSMKQSVGHFMKGMGMGVTLGCAAGVVGYTMLKKNKKGIKHNAGRALHSIGDLLENVTDMF